MDPVTLLICISAAGWIIRALTEDIISAWRGTPSPRIARREARQRLELERIAAGLTPPLTITFSQWLTKRIANPPERRWLQELRGYLDIVIADGFEDARTRHVIKRSERTPKYAPPSHTDPGFEPVVHDNTDVVDDDIVDAEVVVHDRTPADGDPVHSDGRIRGLPCRVCGDASELLSVDNRCRRCVRGKFGFSHYCIKRCGEPVDDRGQTCPSCAAGRFEITCGCCGTARTEPLCPVCTEGGTCPICLPSPPAATKPEPSPSAGPADTSSPTPDSAPEPTRKDTPPMPNTQNGTTVINGDVGSPEEAVVYCEATLGFNDAVANQIDIALSNLRTAGVGQGFLDIIETGLDGTRQFKTTVEGARVEYADHVLAKADLSSNDDLRDTLLGYLSAARG